MSDFDLDAYTRAVREGPCFICALVAGDPPYHHVVYDDGVTIAFLNRYPTLRGYCLVAPRRHVEDWVRDLDEQAHLALQAAVHRVARAVAAVVPTERMYALSLGSAQGNAHIHWHVAPLPPGVPYERQQYHALMAEHAGILPTTEADQATLATEIRAHLAR